MMFLHPQLFGLPNGVAAVKASFVTVAIWWIVFTIPLMMIVPEPGVEAVSQESIFSLIGSSVRQMIHSCQELAQDRNLLLFVLSFWLYIDGVYTVITMAVDYGISLGFRSQDLIAALLITQFVGFPAAFLFGKLAPKIGCRIPISICIGVYAVTVIGATQMTQAYQFYILAAVIGLVQGGVQSLSRSMFSRMIPKEKSGEYFGLFNLVGKFASILGPMIVAATALVVHEPRLSMLGLLFLFALGASLLYFVKEPQT
jgi:UMF1 family MFS transporter